MSGTKSFSPDQVQLYVGTTPDDLEGTMTVLMKTNRYYTDGTLKQAKSSYTVTREWGRTAIEAGWAEDTGAVLPVQDSPGFQEGAVAALQAMAAGAVKLISADTDEAASTNVLILQAAVDRVGPGGEVLLAANQGTVEINATVYHDNLINIGAGTTLKLRTGSTTTMFKNRAWDAARTTLVSMTNSGRVGTLTFTGTPPADLTVGKYVSIIGATTSGHNSVVPITARGATTLTVRLPRTAPVTTATGTVTVCGVDSLVGIVGQGTLDYNEAGQAADGTINTIACIYSNVDRIVLGGGLTGLNAKKFIFLIGAHNDLDAADITARTASDIIHVIGPGTTTKLTDIRGSSGDDAVACTIGDVPWFGSISQGDYYNIIIGNLNVDSLQAMVRLSGNLTNFGGKFWNVDIDGVVGSSEAAPITIADFPGGFLQGMDFDHIRIRNVAVETGTILPVVAVDSLTAGGGDRLDVDVTQLLSNGAALQINDSTTTVRSVQLRVANPLDGCTKGALEVNGATVSSVRVEGLRAAYGSNVFSVWIFGSGNVQELMITDCEISGSGSRLVAQQATMGRCMMQNIRHTSGYCTFEQNASANANSVLMISNYRGQGLTNVGRFQQTATALTSNFSVVATGVSEAFWNIAATRTLTWRGDVDLNGNTESAGAGTLTKSSSVVV